MSPAFSSAMQKQQHVYIMQEPQKGQHVWVQAVPASSQTFRPAATTTMLQAQPQGQPMAATVYNPGMRPMLTQQQAQHQAHQHHAQQPQQVALIKQQAPAVAPNTVRLVQIAGNNTPTATIQLQQPQAQPQQLVIAPQPAPAQAQQQQQRGDVVYVSVNGVLQQGIVQNGSVYLMNDSAAAPAGSNMVHAQQVQLQPVAAQQPMTVAMTQRQHPMASAATSNGQIIQLHNGQLQQQQQIVLPAGARLVPVSHAAVRAPALTQLQVQQQHQQARPVMTMTVPASMTTGTTAQQQPMMVMMQQGAGGSAAVQSSAPMTMVMVAGPKSAGMQSVASHPQQMQMPMQQVAVRGPVAVPAVGPRPAVVQQQPVQVMQTVQTAAAFNSGTMTGQQQARPMMAVANGGASTGMAVVASAAAAGQQANMQAFRPALAAGAKLLVSGTSVSASTASLMNKAPAGAQQAAPGGSVSAMPTALNSNKPQVRQLMMPVSNGAVGAASQPVMVPAASRQQQLRLGGTTPAAAGELSSPPVPPLTPGVAAVGGGAANTLPAVLNSDDKDGAAARGDGAVVRLVGGSQSPVHGVIGGQRRSRDGLGLSRCGTPCAGGSPASSAPGSQPGTPVRSNSGGGLATESSSSSSLPGSEAAGAGSKEAVMRLVARSFIETGITLEQALTMIQSADRDLLAAAFAAEAAGAPLPAAAAPAAAAAATAGVGGLPAASSSADAASNTSSTGLGGNGAGPSSKGFLGTDGLGLSGLNGLSFADELSYAIDNSVNMGSWGFSLFSGSAVTDMNGSTADGGSLGLADPLLSDVAAAPTTNGSTAAPQAAGKESAMLASLNL